MYGTSNIFCNIHDDNFKAEGQGVRNVVEIMDGAIFRPSIFSLQYNLTFVIC